MKIKFVRSNWVNEKDGKNGQDLLVWHPDFIFIYQKCFRDLYPPEFTGYQGILSILFKNKKKNLDQIGEINFLNGFEILKISYHLWSWRDFNPILWTKINQCLKS